MEAHTVYISGPMTGHPEYNYDEFNRRDQELQDRGFATINPALTGEADTARLCRKPTWHDYMVSAISRMRHATAIHFLPGHESSFGARIEAIVAEKMQLEEVGL